jgi:hypothetical protein
MNAISRPVPINYNITVEEHSSSQTELASHRFDLRIHALIMLATAMLAAYCGIRISGIDSATIAGDMGSIAGSPDPLSMSAMTVFIAVAALCLLEAHRGWRKSAISGPRNKSRAVAQWQLTRSSAVISK